MHKAKRRNSRFKGIAKVERRVLKGIKTKDIALMAVLLSIMLLFVFLPVNIGAVDMAFVTLVPIIVATQVKGLRYGMFMSVAFGLASFAVAFSMRSILSPLFQNPLISILPRVFIGVTTYFSCKGVNKLLARTKIDGRLKSTLAYLISSIVGVCTNTFLVLGMLMLVYHGRNMGAVTIGWALIGSILATNFVIELVATTVICVPVSRAVSKLLYGDKTVKSNNGSVDKEKDE